MNYNYDTEYDLDIEEGSDLDEFVIDMEGLREMAEDYGYGWRDINPTLSDDYDADNYGYDN